MHIKFSGGTQGSSPYHSGTAPQPQVGLTGSSQCFNACIWQSFGSELLCGAV